MAKDNDYIKLIHSKKWVKLRNIYLSRHPLCEICRRSERLRPATEVHHKKPIETGYTYADKERLAYDVNNLMALCSECHRNEHIAMRSGSNETRRQRTEDYKAWFKSEFID